MRYIETNPVQTGLAKKPEDWGDFLFSARAEKDTELLRKHERTGGRPLGGEKFIDRPEVTLGMSLKPQKPGRKPKDSE